MAMPSSRPPETPASDAPLGLRRRSLLLAGSVRAGLSLGLGAAAGLPGAAWAEADSRGAGDPQALLRQGGVVVAFRHALAPRTFDPPEFRLDDCSTQRNLNDAGRAQAQRVGAWFRQRQLVPARVRSSPWCRCIDTATLAFGTAPDVWPALGSPRGVPETTGEEHLRALRQALAAVSSRPGGFEVWFTHMFVLSDLASANTASAEGLVLRTGRDGGVRVLARVPAPPA